MDLASKIEALLFYRAEAVSKQTLTGWLKVDDETLAGGLAILRERLRQRGVRLLVLEDQVTLSTAPELAELLQAVAAEERSTELGKATLETLTIVVYHGPVSRPAIDQIRGVNSSFSLRHLLARGLIERFNPEGDSRRWLYRPTLDLLRHLGLEQLTDLPEYATVQTEIKNFLTVANHHEETA